MSNDNKEVIVIQSSKKQNQFYDSAKNCKKSQNVVSGSPSENSSLNNDSMSKMYDELSLKPHMIKTMNEINTES